jgi:membrane-bound metal-dependent hydrolase YbcI (DUF457 family)
MPQAGIHGMVGMAARRWTQTREWLLLGALLGSFVPDMDNLAVAAATLTGASTDGLHRTMTHSVFFIVAVVAAFYLISQWKREVRWNNLGLGLGLGILLHSLLDLVIWFNGVELFWPLGGEINFWVNSTPPEWFMKLMDPAEFLCFGLYLWVLGTWARKQSTDGDFMSMHGFWMWLEFALFVLFTPLAYILTKGYLTVFGALYLFSLLMTFFVTIRMRKTVGAVK